MSAEAKGYARLHITAARRLLKRATKLVPSLAGTLDHVKAADALENLERELTVGAPGNKGIL